MTTEQFIGMLVLALGSLAALISYFAVGAWKLAKSITMLDATLNSLKDGFVSQGVELKEHHELLHDHDLLLREHTIVLREHGAQIGMLVRDDR